MDVHSPEQRRFNMSRIRGKDTRPEMMVRGWLWANGYRYRLHRKDLPGRPDIVLPKYRVVIFVHGCFWHRHGCKFTTTPEARFDFWQSKFQENIRRDKRNIDELIKHSWRVMIVWECALQKKTSVPDDMQKQISDFLLSETSFSELSS